MDYESLNFGHMPVPGVKDQILLLGGVEEEYRTEENSRHHSNWDMHWWKESE